MKRTKFLFEILISAIIPRVVLVFLTLFILKAHFSQYVAIRDGAGYISLSAAFANMDFSKVLISHTRLFPGYPIIISLLGRFIGFGMSAIFLNLLCTFISCYLYFLIFKDKKTAVFFLFLPPAWLMYTNIVMPEALSMAIILASLYLFLKDKYKSALALVVFGVIVKPVILFLFIIYLFLLIKERRYGTVAYGGLLFIAIYISYYLFYHTVFRDIFLNYHIYASEWNYGGGGKMFTFPYFGILRHILYPQNLVYNVPIWKRIYMLFNIIFFVIGLFFVIQAFKAQRDKLSTIALLWSSAIFLFAGSLNGWSGFHCYDRYILPAMPFLFYSMKELAPRGKIFLLSAFIGSFIYALLGNINGFRYLK